MNEQDIHALEVAHAACPAPTPYVTSNGGVVILNGPFPVKTAQAVHDWIVLSYQQTPHVLAELQHLRGLLSDIIALAGNWMTEDQFYAKLREARKALVDGGEPSDALL